MRTVLLLSLSVMFSGFAYAQKPAKEPTKKEPPKAAKDLKQEAKNSKKTPTEPKKVAKKSAAEEALAAEMQSKGLVEAGGAWVDKQHVEDAKRGVFHWNDEIVTKSDYNSLQSGKVRHAVTGELIEAADLEKSRGRSFPIEGGKKWVEEKEADAFHAKDGQPWTLTSQNYVFVSTLPIAKLESLREHGDRAIARLATVLGDARPLPVHKPTVIIASTQDAFVRLGTQIGDEGSAYGGFLAREEAKLELPNGVEVRPAVCLWDESWGPYYLPHAIGLAQAHGLAASGDAELPAWLLQGLAALGSRFGNAETGKWFCQNLAKSGGLKPVDKFVSGFAIDGEMDSDSISANLTQAGFLLDFAASGGDKDSAAALTAFGEALRAQKESGIDKAANALQSTLLKALDNANKHFQKLIR